MTEHIKFGVVGLVLCLSAIGCKPIEIVPSGGKLLPPSIALTDNWPDYGQLVDRYNSNIEAVDQLWARSKVSVVWRDAKGKKRHEQGDGNVIVVRPRRVVLTVGKLGNIGLWAGCNESEYWLFDLQEKVAYVGRHKNVGMAGSKPFPLPIRPEQVPYILGMMPLDRNLVPAAPAVEQLKGYALIQPPGLGLRMLINPQTGRVVRIDLLDKQGNSTIVSKLSDYQTVQVVDPPLGQIPQMPSKAEIYVIDGQARMTLKLSHLSDGRGKNSIQDRAFMFGRLIKAHKPEHVILLDEAAQ